MFFWQKLSLNLFSECIGLASVYLNSYKIFKTKIRLTNILPQKFELVADKIYKLCSY